MTDDSTARCAPIHRVVEPARLRMTWAVEAGPGRTAALIARWETADPARLTGDALDRRPAA